MFASLISGLFRLCVTLKRVDNIELAKLLERVNVFAKLTVNVITLKWQRLKTLFQSKLFKSVAATLANKHVCLMQM